MIITSAPNVSTGAPNILLSACLWPSTISGTDRGVQSSSSKAPELRASGKKLLACAATQNANIKCMPNPRIAIA